VDQSAVAKLRNAVEAADEWYSVSGNIRKDASEDDQELLARLEWAFDYDLAEREEEERRSTWGPWAPMIETQQGAYPPALTGVAIDTLGLWAEAADDLRDLPLAASRLNDLLWERRYGDSPYLRAQFAIDAYLALAPGLVEPLLAAQSLIRALELARSINDAGRESQAIAACVAASRVSMAAGEAQPGVSLRLIEALGSLPPSRQPAELDRLIDEAYRTYGDDPWIAQTVVDLKVARTPDPEDTIELRRAQVLRWIDAANKAEGLVRMSFLQRALEAAELHGLKDESTQLLRELQSISADDLDLKTVSAAVNIPTDQVEEYVNAFMGQTWEESLERLGALAPPSGDYERNLADVQQLAVSYPLQFLLTKVVLGPDNTRVAIVSSKEEHENAALAEQEARSIAIAAIFSADVLERVRSRFGEPPTSDVGDYFTTPEITSVIAERLARAVELFWLGQYDECVHVILPRLEAVIRNMCRDMGFVVIKEPQGAKPGGVRTLGELIRGLKGHYDESWRRYLWNLLAEPLGTNLRNLYLHGLVPPGSREHAALLVQAACHLRLVRIGPQQRDALSSSAPS
jgi:hypothetical protein